MKRTPRVLTLSELTYLILKFLNTSTNIYYRFKAPDYNKLILDLTILNSDFEYQYDFDNNVFIVNTTKEELYRTPDNTKLDDFLDINYTPKKIISSVQSKQPKQSELDQIRKFISRFQEYLESCENQRLSCISQNQQEIDKLNFDKRLVDSIKKSGRITDYGYQKINLSFNDKFLDLDKVTLNLYVLDDVCELEVIIDNKIIDTKNFGEINIDFIKEFYNKKYTSLTNYYQNKIQLCNLYQEKIINSRNAIQTNFLEFLI